MPDTNKKVRVAFGPVSIVRAIPSREVSVINIEVPEEFHIEVTNLFYRRDVLISLARLNKTPYGVLDPDTATQESSGDEPQEVRAIHGCVCGVRAVPSRDISIISVEVPETAHVEVTQLLYGKEVIVIPVALGASKAYGVIKGAGCGTDHTANARAGSATPPRPQPTVYPSRQPGRLPGNIHIAEPYQVNPVRWVAMRCGEDAFQDFMGVRNEAAAADKVREICGIESRAELNSSPRAKEAFMTHIYNPFTSRSPA